MNPYHPPTISRHRAGGENATALGGDAAPLTAIDGVAVADLVKRHGSPLFVFSEQTLRTTHRAIAGEFRQRYADTQFGWSYKTNYLKAVCRVFHQEGALAEVVSGFEYDKARALGMTGGQIVFNGPHKSRADLERAVADGACLQVDNFEELALLEAIAREQGRTIPVGLRVFMDTGIRPVWSKFGFCVDDGEAGEAIRWMARSGGLLTLAGLHSHLGTCILEPDAYGEAVETLIDVSDWARRTYGFDVDWFNLGGGLPSSATLHGQYLPARQSNPPVSRYAEQICQPLNRRYAGDQRRPVLLLETGRAMVDDAGTLLTTVVAIKGGHEERTPNMPVAFDPKGLASSPPGMDAVRPGVVIDAGVHLLYTAAWYRLEVRPTRVMAGPPRERRLFGCLCMNIDVVRESVPLSEPAAGDVLAIQPVGAYALTQSMQFIAYRPRVVMIDPSGVDHIIREREDLAYVEQMERLPEHLAGNPNPPPGHPG